MDVCYNIPYNSTNADGSISLGLVYPFWGMFRISGSADFGLFNNHPVKAPEAVSGFGMNIPLGRFSYTVDWKKGFDLGSDGINDYCRVYDHGINFKINEKLTLRSYLRELQHFGSQYNVPSDKINYIGLGFRYKL